MDKKSAKKSASKKKAAKNSPVKNKKQTALKKGLAKKTGVLKEETVKDCMCKQKKRNGNFFCFRLINGEWVQASDLGFPSKETCEAATCGE